MELVVDDKKIECPHCNSNNCFQEDYKVETNTLSSYMCMNCGYTTTTLYKKDSQIIEDYEKQCPDLFKDLKFHDTKTDLIWYPIVLNFPDLGLVFPDGTNAFDWKWRAVPMIKVSEDEKEKYPIPSQPGKFYESRADMESSRTYAPSMFQDACKFLNIIQS